MAETTEQSLIDYPRVAVIRELDLEQQVAWLTPYALIGDRYTHPLPEEEGEDFGAELEVLVAKKGISAALKVGDAFRTFNLNHPEPVNEIIGDYVPDVEAL